VQTLVYLVNKDIDRCVVISRHGVTGTRVFFGGDAGGINTFWETGPQAPPRLRAYDRRRSSEAMVCCWSSIRIWHRGWSTKHQIQRWIIQRDKASSDCGACDAVGSDKDVWNTTFWGQRSQLNSSLLTRKLRCGRDTARCRCKIRYISKFKTASRGPVCDCTAFLFFYFCKSDALRPFKVIQGHCFGRNRKHVCDFLLVRHSNFGPVLHRFRNIARFCARENTPIPP